MKILVVEDDPSVLGFLESWLLSCQHDVRAYVSGRSAIDMLRCWQPEVLLCEVDMPEVCGEELARAARALPRPARVILMSDDPRRLAESRKLAQALLLKPFKVEELMKQVDPRTTDDAFRPHVR
jgi:CheY-like chemotaxis protein